MARACEVQVGGGWQVTAMAQLRPGDVFRLFEADGAPVTDADGVSRWRALAAAQVIEDGTPTIEAEPYPETDVERAVSQRGMFWPGDGEAGPTRQGFSPSRLRGGAR
jgi:hypothetical protein